MELHSKIDKELWAFVRPTYEVGNYTGAIIASVQYLSDLIRKKSGLTGDGQQLVGGAFGGQDPIIKINDLRSDSEKDEQRGIESLLRGIYTGIRNPRVHSGGTDTLDSADVLIAFVNWLISLIQKSESPFDPEVILRRILDPHFVPRAEYARLVIQEIPPGLRLDIALELIRRTDWPTIEPATIICANIWSYLQSSEQSSYLAALNRQLLEAQEEVDFVIGVNLALSHWDNLSLIARQRAENRMIRAVSEAEETALQSLSPFSLEVRAVELSRSFTLKENLLKTLEMKVNRDNHSDEDYFFKYWTEVYAELNPKGHVGILLKAGNRLRANDCTVYEALGFLDSANAPEKWLKFLKKDWDEFVPF